MLTKEYIRNIVDGIIAEAEAAGKVPACCSARDVRDALHEAARHFLNELVADGTFGVIRNVNREPMLVRPGSAGFPRAGAEPKAATN